MWEALKYDVTNIYFEQKLALRRSVHIRIASVCECLYACVCPPPRLLITSGVIWCDIDPIRWVK